MSNRLLLLKIIKTWFTLLLGTALLILSARGLKNAAAIETLWPFITLFIGTCLTLWFYVLGHEIWKELGSKNDPIFGFEWVKKLFKFKRKHGFHRQFPGAGFFRRFTKNQKTEPINKCKVVRYPGKKS